MIACGGSPRPDRCRAPIEVGPCEALIAAWAYDGRAHRCVSFDYGGCDGNDNRFDSREDCRAVCGGD